MEDVEDKMGERLLALFKGSFIVDNDHPGERNEVREWEWTVGVGESLPTRDDDFCNVKVEHTIPRLEEWVSAYLIPECGIEALSRKCTAKPLGHLRQDKRLFEFPV